MDEVDEEENTAIIGEIKANSFYFHENQKITTEMLDEVVN